MLEDEIKAGESAKMEFKVEVPAKSENYIKSVVAFANTAGGKIIIGVDDKTRDVVGVDKNEVFKIMDNITNTISDMCYPQIFPNIRIDTLDGDHSFDELACVGEKYDAAEAEKLCAAIKEYMIMAAKTQREKETVEDVTVQNLVNWGVIKNLDGTLVPTNAFILLTQNTFPFAKIQCALFKGTERVVFMNCR